MAHKLLLADDSVTIQRVIELTFADENIDVITVGDGQLAIERLETDPPDIVLADVDMPKRDGYEVAAYVKSRPRLAHIPVVLLTGAFEPIDQVRAAAAGSSDVLAKPFEPQMVINRVKELLGKMRQNEEEQYEQLPPRQPMGATSTAPPIAQIAKPTPVNGQTTGETGSALSLDDYFDQLDAAFSNLQPGSQMAEAAHEEIDWATAMAPAAVASHAPIAPVAPEPVASAVAPSASAFAPSASADKPAEKPADKPADRPIAPETVAVDAPVAPAVSASAPSAFAYASSASASAPSASAFAPSASAFAPSASAFAPSASAFAPSASADKPADKPADTPADKWDDKLSDKPVALVAPIAPETVPVTANAPTEPAPKPVTQRITTNPFATLSAAKAEAAARPAAPVITDEVIEEVVSRVLQRLSDKVVRETVTAIVSETAERLVQEEIERIKNAGS